MVKLILAGGGSERESEAVDDFFKKLLSPSSGNILYIPVALRHKKNFNDCLKWFKNTFTSFKITMVNDLQEVDSLDDYDAVYIGGGNTFNLLEEIKSSRFDLKLSSYIQKGGLVYGGSAGAIILGKDITTSPDKNTTNLASFKGLNLLNGFSVWPHYDLKEEQGLQSFLKGKNKVIAIPEQSGAYVEDNKILNLGNAPIVIFDPKRKEVKPGQYVKI